MSIHLNIDKGIALRKPSDLVPWEGNPRTHSEKQLTALMGSIKQLGFQVPVITNEDGIILAGHGRVEAAKRLGLKEIPTIVAAGLSKAEQRAFVLGDNKIASMSKWDNQLLRSEIQFLLDADFHIETTGFSTCEIDIMLDDCDDPEELPGDALQPEDIEEQIITARPDDLWVLGKHRLFCGDALELSSYGPLFKSGEVAQMCITDPPYNVKINGHVTGKGQKKHEEFVMASGEMSPGEFTDFLGKACENISSYTQEGGAVFCFMDWRHMREILDAGEQVFGNLKQLCIWNKDNAGMGTFYRSQHEMVFVFRNGEGEIINNFELGQYGRYRSNVWNYPGVNTFTGKGYKKLALHPTVKPVSLIADAVRDCSHRNGLVLDPFAGSGTILIACERSGRAARAIEYEPKYIDVAIRRWQRVTGKSAVHERTGLTFNERNEYFKAGNEDEPYVKI
jgi:DNA modification methylase